MYTQGFTSLYTCILYTFMALNMARKQINSDILAQYDVGEIFKAMYNNSLGINEGGGEFKEMSQGQVITARAVLDKYIPSQKAIEHKVDKDTLTSLAIYKGNAPKPADN
jgi:hypothetical protein